MGLGLFVILDFALESLRQVLFGLSEPDFAFKRERSLLLLTSAVALIVFRQKFELQIAKKYDLDLLQLSKFLVLVPYLVMLSLLPYLTRGGDGNIVFS